MLNDVWKHENTPGQNGLHGLYKEVFGTVASRARGYEEKGA